MEFVAIDVETANPDMASICQIGAARFADGALVEEWKRYVDPKDYFHEMNVAIHGIDSSAVAGAPTFAETATEFHETLSGRIVVSHTHFDRVAVHQASNRFRVSPPNCIWLDSAKVARRAWEKYASRGYGLSNICKEMGYGFKHHDALEDAKAAGHILLAAVAETGLDLEAWLKRVEQPIDLDGLGPKPSIKRQGKSEGPLTGEVVVFTGALDIPWHQAADMAAEIGCQVTPGVTKKTTILVVGDQDVTRLAGHAKSSKHRKAEELILKGQSIQILRETGFRELVALSKKQ